MRKLLAASAALLLASSCWLLGATEEYGEEDPGAERAREFGTVDGDGVRAGMVRFVLPWNDTVSGPTDMRFLNDMPAGRFGRVEVRADGDLSVNDEKIRFFAVNICFSAAVPERRMKLLLLAGWPSSESTSKPRPFEAT